MLTDIEGTTQALLSPIDVGPRPQQDGTVRAFVLIRRGECAAPFIRAFGASEILRRRKRFVRQCACVTAALAG
jgi:hypothetical protein